LKALSPALAAVVEAQEMHRYEVIRQVWKYIRANNLQV
jgi:chromatin remodeling complex protein RSC6